ncbi:hypothetical protein ILUMI_13809 [Ignelater luminosus]|uniref:Peptidase S1 domain-containing protein n=1 Tax=Ignelater luminosus TaxID=2038154 RepID=A0A8K0D004_IGNLU|nr:hypothetical protein ILUMI_13809 [Ignelater luminosus]
MYLPNNIIILCIFQLFLFLNEFVCCEKQRKQTSRILERKDVSFKSFSFIAPVLVKPSDRHSGLFLKESLICSSSIITNYWALSSRQCYDEIRKYEIVDTDLLLKSGTNHWNATKQTELNLKLHDVESLHTEHYLGVLMLIKVVQSFVSEGIIQAPIAGKSYNYDIVTNLELLGYGSMVSSHLQYLQGTRLPESRCRYGLLDNYTLCVGPVKNKNLIKYVCRGDVGGPIVNSADEKVLVGVVNQKACFFGRLCVEHIKIGPLETKLREFSKMVENMTGMRFV